MFFEIFLFIIVCIILLIILFLISRSKSLEKKNIEKENLFYLGDPKDTKKAVKRIGELLKKLLLEKESLKNKLKSVGDKKEKSKLESKIKRCQQQIKGYVSRVKNLKKMENSKVRTKELLIKQKEKEKMKNSKKRVEKIYKHSMNESKKILNDCRNKSQMNKIEIEKIFEEHESISEILSESIDLDET